MAMPLAAHRFTVDEYHRMGEAGVFHEDDRVELIDGHVVAMTPIGPAHGGCVNRLTMLFAPPLAGREATLSVQNPLVLAEHQEPQPDVAVLRYRADGYQTGHPRALDTLLVVEVADTSLAYDRDVKLPRYARAAVPEVWLVDLAGDAIVVHREPSPDRYRDIVTLTRGDTLRPLLLPGVAIAAADILG
ncbi:MAG: Uma2 family endonuclease [Deltaproteobacteria bacterium]|nr:Uma2 family endonuclease [Deltaproteobacteria bacterium]